MPRTLGSALLEHACLPSQPTLFAAALCEFDPACLHGTDFLGCQQCPEAYTRVRLMVMGKLLYRCQCTVPGDPRCGTAGVGRGAGVQLIWRALVGTFKV